MALALTTAIVFGLLPALLMSRVDLQRVMKEGGRGHAGPAGRRAHHALVVAEVALAVILLAGAGLLVRAVSRMTGEDPGFRAGGVVTAGIQLSGSAYRGWPQVEQFHSALVDALQRQPGVRAAGASNFLPLAPGWRVTFIVPSAAGGTRPPGDEPTAQYHSVSEGYFEALGVRLVRGRFLDPHDTAQSRGVVVINETLARRYFPSEDPVGRTITSLATAIGPLGSSLMKDRNHVVVGVVGRCQEQLAPIRDGARNLPFGSTVSIPPPVCRRRRRRSGARRAGDPRGGSRDRSGAGRAGAAIPRIGGRRIDRASAAADVPSGRLRGVGARAGLSRDLRPPLVRSH